MIEAVIFDFGGVIAHMTDMRGQRKWEGYLGLSEGELLKTVMESETSARAMVGEVPEEKLWRHIGTTFGLSDEQLLEFRRDFWLGERVDQKLVSFMRGLRPRYKTAVLSNAWSDARDEFVRDYKLDELVDMIVISAEERMAKPDPRIYQLTIERLKVRADAAVFVDDRVENVRAAKAEGIRGVRFQDTAQAISEVQSHLENR
jgi:putative hydrolase of the HAD superfamily